VQNRHDAGGAVESTRSPEELWLSFGISQSLPHQESICVNSMQQPGKGEEQNDTIKMYTDERIIVH